MFRKVLFLATIALILVGTALLFFGGTRQAFAQGETPPEDSSCISCHEDEYYLHDIGNWYCLRETKVACTECHQGHPDKVFKECAHAGLVASPLANDAAVCQNCHPDDYRERAQIYASITGVRPTPRPYATSTSSALIPLSGESADGTKLLGALPPGRGQVAGFGFLGIAFLVSFLFVCRCWKIDHGT